MQKPQPEDENFVESSRILSRSTDQEFVEETAETADQIGGGADMEFVQTQFSPRGVLLLHFRGDAAAEVDKHFNRTFSELCRLPDSSASNSRMESSHWQGVYICNKSGTSLRFFFQKTFVARRFSHQTETRCSKIYLTTVT